MHSSTPRSYEPRATLEISCSEAEIDHSDRPLGQGEFARIWQHTNLHELELFRGSFKKHRFARHFHRVPVIGVVDHGVMGAYCRRAQHVLEPGTVLLFNAGEIHAPEPGDSAGWGMRMFFLNDAALQFLWPGARAEDLRFKEPFVKDTVLAAALARLHRALERPGDRLGFDQLLLEVGDALYERHIIPAARSNPDRSTGGSMQQVLEFMEANCNLNLTLTELAHISPYGTSHFLRRFKESVGLTPHAYLTQVRVEWASRELRSGKPIVEIANSLGFTDQSHLTRHFKRMFGVTPGQYAAALS